MPTRILYPMILAICLLTSYSSSAQMPSGAGRMGGGMNMGHLYGKILDSLTGKALEAASVQLLQSKMDSVTKKRKDVVIAGMLTNKKGEFSLENLPVMGKFKLKITAIGFKNREQQVGFDLNPNMAKGGDYNSMLNAIDKDLGNIKMEADAQKLQDVTVTSTRALLTMNIDRKVFNVEKNLNSVGGTAVDVMKNVPGLNVDIDGNVTMRNASPQIFVDGRPTTMTLEQIPADAIATVELITNPSAKFDASGGGAGILNVVLKKNKKAGYNGNVRSSIDSRGRPGFGGDINIKQKKINLFANGQLGFRKSISTVETDRTDYLKDATAHLLQSNGPVGRGVFGFGRIGADYFADNRNTISISTNMSKGEFKNEDLINITRDTVYNTGNTALEYGSRSSNSRNEFQNIGATLSFKHNFAKSGKELTSDVNFNSSKNENENNFATQYFNAANQPKTALIGERSSGGGTNKFFTGQIDYSNPIHSNTKFETGARIALRDFYSFNDNFYKDASGNYVSVPVLNNRYSFTDRVLAGYVTVSQQFKQWSYNAGLRIESSTYTGTLLTNGQQFSNEYPFSLFPSAYLNYKINDQQNMQLNYSRKINRPNFFQLIPFIDYTDSLNISRGNPNLVPEFTNLLELGYQNQLNKDHNILATVYFKNTEDLIARYQYKDKNLAAVQPDSLIITSYANASRSYSYGLELTAKDKITSWWDMNTNINFYNATVEAGNLVDGVNTNQFSWFAKMNHNFKLPSNFSMQLSGDYQAKTLVLPGGNNQGGGRGMVFGGGNTPSSQGFILPLYGVDFSVKYEFLKNNAASLTLQLSDVFRTRLNSTTTQSIYFVQNSDRRRDPQVFRLNFNWRFGKMDVTLFKRKNVKSEQESMQNGMQGAGQ